MKKLRFFVSLHTVDNDYQMAQASAAERSARKLGMDFELLYSDNDAVTQSTEILKAVQGAAESRPDAIVVEPISSIALPQVARAACDAGIGWAVLAAVAGHGQGTCVRYQLQPFRDWPHSGQADWCSVAAGRNGPVHRGTLAQFRRRPADERNARE